MNYVNFGHIRLSFTDKPINLSDQFLFYIFWSTKVVPFFSFNKISIFFFLQNWDLKTFFLSPVKLRFYTYLPSSWTNIGYLVLFNCWKLLSTANIRAVYGQVVPKQIPVQKLKLPALKRLPLWKKKYQALVAYLAAILHNTHIIVLLPDHRKVCKI